MIIGIEAPGASNNKFAFLRVQFNALVALWAFAKFSSGHWHHASGIKLVVFLDILDDIEVDNIGLFSSELQDTFALHFIRKFQMFPPFKSSRDVVMKTKKKKLYSDAIKSRMT